LEKNPFQKLVKEFLEKYNNKNFAEAETIIKLINKDYPENVFGWKALGTLLKQTGRIKESLDASQKVVELNPNDAEAHNTLAIRFLELGSLKQAEKSFKKAIEIKPDFAMAYNNLANTLRDINKLDEAEQNYKRAIELNPNFSGAYYNLANTLKNLFKLDEAEQNYKKAIELNPNFSEAYNNLGNIQKYLNKTGDAEASYKKAMEIKPDSPAAYNNLGNLLKNLDRLIDAEKNYNKAIELKPNYLEAYLNLCELLEKTNRLDETLQILTKAKKFISNNSPDILFFEALIYFRKENYQSTEKLIKEIKDQEISSTRKANFLKFKAEWFQFTKNFDLAFSYFEQMNTFIKKSNSFKHQNPDKYFEKQQEKLAQTIQLQKEKMYEKSIDINGFQPNFLIGFPRSGTTLLDSILRSHSQIKLIEEKPLIIRMQKNLKKSLKISEIEDIDEQTVKNFSSNYFNELNKYDEFKNEKILIDKLPLNILNAALINKIFPKTKFILALRHPMDCILSCWMQNFEMNNAMANMVDLQRIVDFYCMSMEMFKVSNDRYKLDIHRVRYEDLVTDFKKEALDILNFLELKWEKSLEDFQKTASNRELIKTPSYSQVIKPIFQTASYRWRKYEKYLKQYETKLKPWIKEFGY